MNAAELVAAMRAGMVTEDVEDVNDYLVDTITDAIVILEDMLDILLKVIDDDNERDLL